MASNNDRRILRLLPGLTPKERALYVVRAWKQDLPIDQAVNAHVPREHAPLYNHFMDLLDAATGNLTHFIVIVSLMVDQLDLRFGWLGTLRLWGLETSAVEREAARLSAGAREMLARAPRRWCDEPANASVPDQCAEALIDALRHGVNRRWQELRAAEIVHDELAGDLDGEDLLHPQARDLLEDAKRRLEELARLMRTFDEEIVLVEPEAGLVQQVRDVARR